MVPEWQKLNGAPIRTYNLPHILTIPKFSVNDAGTYVCLTTNENRTLVQVGFELILNSDGHVRLVELKNNNANNPPTIKITFSDKLALARGERVELLCETGKFYGFRFQFLLG